MFEKKIALSPDRRPEAKAIRRLLAGAGVGTPTKYPEGRLDVIHIARRSARATTFWLDSPVVIELGLMDVERPLVPSCLVKL